MEELRSFKAVIVTRHALPDIYDKNIRILEAFPYPKVRITNSSADMYVSHILSVFRKDFDWVINVDDDAFIVDPSAVLSVLKTMREGEFDYCGMADALLFTVRPAFNPCSMNPFFNVFYLPGIWSKIPGNALPLVPYHRNLLRKVDMSRLHPEIVDRTPETVLDFPFKSNCEPFYPLFFSLLTYTSPLFLYGRSYNAAETGVKIGVVSNDDPYTTVLYCPQGREMVYHTWYARNYAMPNPADPSVPPDNRGRIDRAFEAAYARFRQTRKLLTDTNG